MRARKKENKKIIKNLHTMLSVHEWKFKYKYGNEMCARKVVFVYCSKNEISGEEKRRR